MSVLAMEQALLLPAPKPLMAPMTSSEPIDYNHLGPLAAPVKAIASVTQAPEAIAMQSVLAAASVSVQALVDVATLFDASPTSLFLLTVGESGERKSSCDGLAVAGLKKFEKEKRHTGKRTKERKASWSSDCDVIDWPEEFEADGSTGDDGHHQKIIFGDVTIEGLVKALDTNQPSVGLFTDEGGQFFGGHSMKSQNTLGSAARLSKLWDSGEVDMIRASSDPIELFGRRLSSHLMVQPSIAKDVFSNVILKDQGFMSRCLPAWPESNIGNRLIHLGSASTSDAMLHDQGIEDFQNRCIALLRADRRVSRHDAKELEPRPLPLSEEARTSLLNFYNRVELAQGEGGAFSGIRGFASKAPEQAARIAGVMTIYEDLDATEISKETMENAIGLMTWYLSEMRRITAAHIVSEETRLAEDLRVWLTRSWREACITKRAIARRGPSKLRGSKTLDLAMETLERNGWLVPETSEIIVDGQTTSSAWRIQGK